jgi:hypothetical protein
MSGLETSPAPGPLARARAAIDARPVTIRWLLAGPGAILAAVATMAAMPVWLPGGAAGINDIALPILLCPLLWAIPFFYATLAEDLSRCAAVLLGATVFQALLIAFSLSGEVAR